jgi:hypothetical protein
MIERRQKENRWARAALRIFSDKLTAQEIEEALGRKGTRSYNKGDTVGPSQFRQSSACIFDAEVEEHQSLAEHLIALLSFVEPHLNAIRAFAPNCRVDIFCSVSSEGGQVPAVLDHALLQRLANVGFDLKLDLYPPGATLLEES